MGLRKAFSLMLNSASFCLVSVQLDMIGDLIRKIITSGSRLKSHG